MKMKLAVLAGAAALAVPAAGMAQTGPESGWYAGGSLGQASAKDACSGVPGASCDDTDTAFRIFGGYQFNRHFAVEAGYVDLGAVQATAGGFRATTESQAFDFVAVGRLPVGERFAAYGKLGMYFANTDASSDFPGTTGQSKANHDLTYALGLQYDFNRNLGIRGEWQRFQKVGGGTVSEADVDLISIGAVWRFR